MPSVLIPVADGSEELEAVTMIDLLRRAGIEVTVASLDGDAVTCSRRTKLVPDCSLPEALERDFDMLALPGGLPGADHLAADQRLTGLIRRMDGDGRWLAAICAAPKALRRAGVLEGRRATSYPGVLEAEGHDLVTGEAWTRDGHVLTSRGPGTAMDFALELVEVLSGRPKRLEVEQALQRP